MRSDVPPPGPRVPDILGFKHAIAVIVAIWVAAKRFLSPQSKAQEKCFESRVRRLKTVLQMAIGVAITIMLFVKSLLFFPLMSTRLHEMLPPCILDRLASKPPLAIAGYMLALSAAIELAYMLFTAGPDEAVEPVILGFASAALIVSAQPDVTPQAAVIIVVLVAGIAVLFWVRETYIEVERRPGPRLRTRRYGTSSEWLKRRRKPLRRPLRKK